MPAATPGGTSSFITSVYILDSTSTTGAGKTGLVFNTSGLTCYYKRSNGTASVAVSLVTITTLGTYASGGFKAIDGTNMAGLYEFHPPNAAIAAGATSVTFFFTGATGMAPVALQIGLQSVWDEINTGATHNLANSTGKQLRSVAVNTGVIYSGTLPSQAGMTSTTVKLDSGASAVDNAYQWNVYSDLTGADAGDSATITAYNGSTKVATVNTPWAVQPAIGDTFEITPAAQVQVVSYSTGQSPADLVLITPANKLATDAIGGVTLADAVAHGGTPGSSTATFAMQLLQLTNTGGTSLIVNGANSAIIEGTVQALKIAGSGNIAAVSIENAGSAPALHVTGGPFSAGMIIEGGVGTGTGGPALALYGGNANGTGTAGQAIYAHGGAGTAGVAAAQGILVIAGATGGFGGAPGVEVRGSNGNPAVVPGTLAIGS